jgi:hypothetical protein
MKRTTPGPWAGGIAAAFSVWDKSGKIKRFVMVCPRPSEKTDDATDPIKKSADARLSADAQLAASAPELLVALRAVLRERRRESSAALTRAAAAVERATA